MNAHYFKSNLLIFIYVKFLYEYYIEFGLYLVLRQKSSNYYSKLYLELKSSKRSCVHIPLNFFFFNENIFKKLFGISLLSKQFSEY